MWIVLLALRRPLTFIVASLLLLLLTPFVLLRTPTDIFPSINIPVVSVIWSYTGLSAKEVEQRMIYTHERALRSCPNSINPWCRQTSAASSLSGGDRCFSYAHRLRVRRFIERHA